MAATTSGATEGDVDLIPRSPCVLLVGEDGTWFRRDYARAFREAGFGVEFIPTATPEDGPETGAPGDGLSRARARILRQVRWIVSRRDPALAFFYAYDRSLSPSLLKVVRSLSCPSVLLHVDMPGQWYHSVRSCASFTRVVVAQQDHMRALRRRGGRPVYWPMAGFASRPDWSTPRVPVVRFVGTPFPERIQALSALVEAGIPTEIFGRWSFDGSEVRRPKPRATTGAWIGSMLRRARRGLHTLPALLHEEGLRAAFSRRRGSLPPSERDVAHLRAQYQGPVADSELSSTLAGGQVALGCANSTLGGRAGPRYMRLRDFEAPLAGACYLTTESPGLAECFALGKEVLVWRSLEGLVSIARQLLADPGRCLELAHAGWDRARREHTYQARLSSLMVELSIPAVRLRA